MNQHQEVNNNSNEARILEQGDMHFFHRPKKGAEEVKSIEDVGRFFMDSLYQSHKDV